MLFYLEIIDAFQIRKVIRVHETAAVYIVFAGHWGPSNTEALPSGDPFTVSAPDSVRFPCQLPSQRITFRVSI